MLFLAQNIFLGTYAYIISLIWHSVLKQHFATFASHENHTAWGHEMRSPPRPKSYAGENETCERNGDRKQDREHYCGVFLLLRSELPCNSEYK